ncbi:hypothetical protein ScPMuIL_011144 [Solemya velum]
MNFMQVIFSSLSTLREELGTDDNECKCDEEPKSIIGNIITMMVPILARAFNIPEFVIPGGLDPPTSTTTATPFTFIPQDVMTAVCRNVDAYTDHLAKTVIDCGESNIQNIRAADRIKAMLRGTCANRMVMVTGMQCMAWEKVTELARTMWGMLTQYWNSMAERMIVPFRYRSERYKRQEGIRPFDMAHGEEFHGVDGQTCR